MKVNPGEDTPDVSFTQIAPRDLLKDKEALGQFVALFGEFDDAEIAYYKKLHWHWNKCTEKEIVDNLRNKTKKLFLAKIGEEIVGFATIWASKEIDGIDCIAQLAVASKHRNRKIGRGLLQFIFDNVENDLCLRVIATNDAAKHLYASMGFRTISHFMWREHKKHTKPQSSTTKHRAPWWRIR